ncbi:MAG: sigma-54 dependent transcriptional regulator [Nitrospirota bacterium]|jgi:two-component system response regulator FlrC
MSRATVLIVEDDDLSRSALVEALDRAGYRTLAAPDLAAARALAADERIDLTVTDLQLPDGDGLHLLERWDGTGRPPPFVLISGVAEVHDTVRALRLGVADCLTKPFSMAELRQVVARIVGPPKSDPAETGAPPHDPRKAHTGGGPIVACQRMATLFATAARVAPSTATVLIEGESGTGKEVVARFIHGHSDRCRGPFVALNCAAVPDGLLESELFGHERGAFSGAVRRHLGRFEQAHGGTLLLDEIGEMALALQAKLLRTLQERTVQRVGGIQPVASDVRVLATTNKSLREEVDKGRFRLDLFYRLNVIRLHLPPLRQRTEEIPILIDHFLRQYGQATGSQPPHLAPDVTEELVRYTWPGNVRELENAVHRALLLGDGECLRVADFLEKEAAPVDTTRAGTVTAMERDLILTTLEENGGNRSQTAEELGISIRTLRNRLREYRDQGLEVTPARSAG